MSDEASAKVEGISHLPVRCPFCRGNAEIINDRSSDYSQHWSVWCECVSCGGKGPERKTAWDAVEAWNVRPSETPPILSQEEAFQRAVKAGLFAGLVNKPEDTTI